MKKLLPLLLIAVLICGCAANGIQDDTTIKQPTTSTGDNKTEEYDIKNYDYSSYSDNIKYNLNPDVSFKPLPGIYSLSDSYVPSLTEDLMKDAYGVVVVNIKSKSEPIKIETTDFQIDKETGSFVEVPTVYEVPVYEAEVLKSLGGGHNQGDLIEISTYLESYGIKFTEGKNYIVITYKNEFKEEGKVYYPPNCMIHSVFEIKDDYTVVAQSALFTSAKYDGLSLADVAHDLETYYNKSKSE